VNHPETVVGGVPRYHRPPSTARSRVRGGRDRDPSCDTPAWFQLPEDREDG